MNGIAERLRVLNPAQSRKALVALATLIVTIGAKVGLDVDIETIVPLLAVGVALIFGIAIEDGGAKSARPIARGPSTLVDTEKTLGVKPGSFNGNGQSNHGG